MNKRNVLVSIFLFCLFLCKSCFLLQFYFFFHSLNPKWTSKATTTTKNGREQRKKKYYKIQAFRVTDKYNYTTENKLCASFSKLTAIYTNHLFHQISLYLFYVFFSFVSFSSITFTFFFFDYFGSNLKWTNNDVDENIFIQFSSLTVNLKE